MSIKVDASSIGDASVEDVPFCGYCPAQNLSACRDLSREPIGFGRCGQGIFAERGRISCGWEKRHAPA
jgi:hypothetical protein